MKLKSMLLIIFALAATAQAQEPWPNERPDERQQAVINEDGGRAFIVRPASAPLIGIVKPGGPAVGDLQQHSIFLGSGWANPALRAREPRLGSLLANIRDQAQMDEIAKAGMNNLFGPTSSMEKFDVAGERNITDLEIQSILSNILKASPRPNASSIYMVFLDPTFSSTLGPLVADKHYIAYHAFLNVAGARVHYVVLPFQPDSQGAYQIALRALVVAALHSEEAPH
jgi:hypothetical protein